jgi:hypothetical protein
MSERRSHTVHSIKPNSAKMSDNPDHSKKQAHWAAPETRCFQSFSFRTPFSELKSTQNSQNSLLANQSASQVCQWLLTPSPEDGWIIEPHKGVSQFATNLFTPFEKKLGHCTQISNHGAGMIPTNTSSREQNKCFRRFSVSSVVLP